MTTLDRLDQLARSLGYDPSESDEGAMSVSYSDPGRNVPSVSAGLRHLVNHDSMFINASPSLSQGPLGTCSTFAIILALSDAYKARSMTKKYSASKEFYPYDDSLNPYLNVNISNPGAVCSSRDQSTWNGASNPIYQTIASNGAPMQLSRTLDIIDTSISQYNKPIEEGTQLYHGDVVFFGYRTRRTRYGYTVDGKAVSYPEYLRCLRTNFLMIKDCISKGYGITCGITNFAMPLDTNLDNGTYERGDGHAMSIYGVSGNTVHVRNSWKTARKGPHAGNYHTFTWYRNPHGIMSELAYVKYTNTTTTDKKIDVSPCIKSSLLGDAIIFGILYDLVIALINHILGGTA